MKFLLKFMMGKADWEVELTITAEDDGKEDADNDGLIEEEEERLGLSDFVPDFDGDGFDDFTEISEGSDPKDSKHTSSQKPASCQVFKLCRSS